MGRWRLLGSSRVRFAVVAVVLLAASALASGGRWPVVAIVAAVLAVVYVFRHTLFRLVLWAIGRARGVPFGVALRHEAQDRAMEREVARLRQASRMVERDPAGYEKWDTPRGAFWIPSRKIAGDALLEMLAEEALEIYGHGPAGVNPGDVVLDCGANVGTFVREALAAGAQRVIASEPTAANLECLRRNCPEALADGRLVLVPKGVWHEETQIQLYVSDSPAGDSFVVTGRKAEGPVLDVTTIDEITESMGLKRLDFIKFDIEGAERNALRGAARTLRSLHPTLAVSAYHLKDDPDVLSGIIDQTGVRYHKAVIGARLFVPGLLSSYMLPIVLLFRRA